MTAPTESQSPAIKANDPRNKFATGIFLAIWAVAGWVSLLNNSWIIDQDYGLDPGPGLLPYLVLGIISIGALGEILFGLFGIAIGRSGQPIQWRAIGRAAILPGLLLITLLAYVPLVRLLGFIPATAFVSVGWMAIIDRHRLRSQPRRAVASLLLGTVVVVGFVYLLFIYAIGVPLR